MPFSRLLQPHSWPIGVKIACDLLLVALIPLAVILFWTAGQTRTALRNNAKEALTQLAGAISLQLDQMMTDTARANKNLALSDAIIALCEADEAARGGRLAPVQRELVNLLKTNPDFGSAFVISNAGVGLASTSEANVGMDFNFRDYFRQAAAGQEFVSEIVVGRTSREPGIYFSAPVRAGEKVIGVAVIKLRGERLHEILDAVQMNHQGYALLVDADGIVTVRPNKNLLYRSLVPLDAETLRRVDPMTRYSISNVESDNVPALWTKEIQASRSGATEFNAVVQNDARRSWVGGYHVMTTKPWKVFVVESFTAVSAESDAVFRRQVIIGLVVAVIAGLIAVWRARSIVRPVIDLSSAAGKLAAGDFSARAAKHSDDELGQLADAFNAMVPQLQDKVHLQHSLKVAMQVQQSLLPDKDPEHPRLDIAGRSKYCDETGGDYYDFLAVAPAGGEASLIAVGDVMGHGIASALLMASARAALRSHATEVGALHVLLDKVNKVLAGDRHNRFMTLMLIAIDPDKGTARWASAGHDPVIVYHPQTDNIEELEGAGFPLGVDRESMYEEFSTAGLHAGDVLIIGTDGIWEMANEAEENFGKDRLYAIVRAQHAQPASVIAEAIESELRKFRGPRAAQDDVTFVIIKIK